MSAESVPVPLRLARQALGLLVHRVRCRGEVERQRRLEEHERVARDLDSMGYADLAAEVRQRGHPSPPKGG